MSAVMEPLKSSKLVKFRAWLTERGAELLATTNPYEVVRYRAGPATQVIYRNDANTRWTAVNGADEALRAFKAGHRWSAPIERVRNGHAMSEKLYNALVQRDGPDCFYCGQPVELAVASNEHMVPRAHGGPNHLSNFVLTHKPCNQAAGCLSVAEKVRMRDALRVR